MFNKIKKKFNKNKKKITQFLYLLFCIIAILSILLTLFILLKLYQSLPLGFTGEEVTYYGLWMFLWVFLVSMPLFYFIINEENIEENKSIIAMITALIISFLLLNLFDVNSQDTNIRPKARDQYKLTSLFLTSCYIPFCISVLAALLLNKFLNKINKKINNDIKIYYLSPEYLRITLESNKNFFDIESIYLPCQYLKNDTKLENNDNNTNYNEILIFQNLALTNHKENKLKSFLQNLKILEEKVVYFEYSLNSQKTYYAYRLILPSSQGDKL
ncbi:hypothetical protein [Neisseria animaloris]|uniref:hypothetical protein n=1 Tax=Neisseria animaloris TaxID=326522 RepID=UPI000D311F22|nr:hypothetical protein [Neisseria animaloris]